MNHIIVYIRAETGFYDPGMTSIGHVMRKPGADPEFSFRGVSGHSWGVSGHSEACQVIQRRVRSFMGRVRSFKGRVRSIRGVSDQSKVYQVIQGSDRSFKGA